MTLSHRVEICGIDTPVSCLFGRNNDGERFSPSPGGRQRVGAPAFGASNPPASALCADLIPFLSHVLLPLLPGDPSLRQFLILSPHGPHHGRITINDTDPNREDIS